MQHICIANMYKPENCASYAYCEQITQSILLNEKFRALCTI